MLCSYIVATDSWRVRTRMHELITQKLGEKIVVSNRAIQIRIMFLHKIDSIIVLQRGMFGSGRCRLGTSSRHGTQYSPPSVIKSSGPQRAHNGLYTPYNSSMSGRRCAILCWKWLNNNGRSDLDRHQVRAIGSFFIGGVWWLRRSY